MNKHFSWIAVLLGLVIASGSANAQLTVSSSGAKQVTLNDKVNNNQFVWVSEAPLENTRGTSEGVTGTFSIDPANIAAMRGTISSLVATMKTGNAARDNHLVGPQWLDATKYPKISFTITSIAGVLTTGNIATGTATGTFMMHGISKTITIPFKLTYLSENDKTRQRAPGDLVMISADFTIALKDFKVAGSEGVIGSKVGEVIKINAQLFGNTN
ncbi:MAG: YceI family protein [Candidatus Kapaibacterium sp.]|jgi:polyisoprenoid-binding protein YceI